MTTAPTSPAPDPAEIIAARPRWTVYYQPGTAPTAWEPTIPAGWVIHNPGTDYDVICDSLPLPHVWTHEYRPVTTDQGAPLPPPDLTAWATPLIQAALRGNFLVTGWTHWAEPGRRRHSDGTVITYRDAWVPVLREVIHVVTVVTVLTTMPPYIADDVDDVRRIMDAFDAGETFELRTARDRTSRINGAHVVHIDHEIRPRP